MGVGTGDGRLGGPGGAVRRELEQVGCPASHPLCLSCLPALSFLRCYFVT